MDILIDQLQTVPITGNHDTLPPIIGADLADSTDHIVRLPALALINGNIHCPQNVLHQRHLHCQFFGHSMPGRLVAIVAQMPESGPMEIEGHTNRIRLFLLLHPFQNIQETVDGIGINAFPGGQRPDTEISPVDDTVAV